MDDVTDLARISGVCSDFFLQSIPQAATEGLFGADRVNEP